MDDYEIAQQRLVSPQETSADGEENNLRPRTLEDYVGQEKVKENLRFVKGVKDIQASAETQKITVVYDADKTTVEKIQKSLEKIGYKTRLTTKEEVIKEGCHSNCCDGK